MFGLLIPAVTFIVLPFAIALAIRLLRRPAMPALPPNWEESQARLQRLEVAVDAIAVEVERISEGQRFLTRVLSRGDEAVAMAASLGAGDRESQR